MRKAELRGIIAGISLAACANAGTVAVQDFDGGVPAWSYSVDVAAFSNSWGSGFFGLIDKAAATTLDYSGLVDTIFAENDLNHFPDGTNGFATLTFSGVDITGLSGVRLSFDYDIEGYNASADDVKYQIFHNGVGQGEVLLHDGGVDPDDSEGTTAFAIPDGVTNVALTLSIKDNGDTGYSGFDHFKLEDGIIFAPDDPSSLLAMAMGASTVELTFGTNGAGDTIVICYDLDGSFSVPSGSVPALGQPFAGGTLIYSGTGTAFSHTALANNTPYYYKAWSVDGGDDYSDGLEADSVTGLGPGAIAFVGVNADGDDDIAFVALTTIPAATEITITDDEWGGSSFDVQEGGGLWTAPAGGVAKGLVVVISDVSGTPVASIGSASVPDSSPNFNADNEGIFAIRGTRVDPDAFLAGFSSDGDVGFTTLARTGLTLGLTAIDFDGTDGMDDDIFAYAGPRTGKHFQTNYLPLINNPANWIYENGTGDQSTNGVPPDLPFDMTPFLSETPTVFVVQ
ncbi:MAG: hypothetical protein HQ523_02675 [Lentisphaerae bacterium]|nr:hypothetical protein [Lentisphaerota bacterium]